MGIKYTLKIGQKTHSLFSIGWNKVDEIFRRPSAAGLCGYLHLDFPWDCPARLLPCVVVVNHPWPQKSADQQQRWWILAQKMPAHTTKNNTVFIFIVVKMAPKFYVFKLVPILCKFCKFISIRNI
jgi:hypothetical protein